MDMNGWAKFHKELLLERGLIQYPSIKAKTFHDGLASPLGVEITLLYSRYWLELYREGGGGYIACQSVMVIPDKEKIRLYVATYPDSGLGQAMSGAFKSILKKLRAAGFEVKRLKQHERQPSG